MAGFQRLLEVTAKLLDRLVTVMDWGFKVFEWILILSAGAVAFYFTQLVLGEANYGFMARYGLAFLVGWIAAIATWLIWTVVKYIAP
jgi:hypothetical protein